MHESTVEVPTYEYQTQPVYVDSDTQVEKIPRNKSTVIQSHEINTNHDFMQAIMAKVKEDQFVTHQLRSDTSNSFTSNIDPTALSTNGLMNLQIQNEDGETINLQLVRSDNVVELEPENRMNDLIGQQTLILKDNDMTTNVSGIIQQPKKYPHIHATYGHSISSYTCNNKKSNVAVDRHTKQPGSNKSTYQSKVMTAPLKPIIKPDLNNPISLSDDTIVIIKGKKCFLRRDADTGQMVAYPAKLEPLPGQKRRGRPRKCDTQSSTVTESNAPSDDTTDNMIDTGNNCDATSAAQSLLELGNVGPDGIRRSGRQRKRAKVFEDYELGKVGSDESDEELTVHLPLDVDLKSDVDDEWIAGNEGVENEYVNADEYELNEHSIKRRPGRPRIHPITPMLYTGAVKRGRGRPRRYPLRRNENELSSPIPAYIIPCPGGGQTIYLAPQGVKTKILPLQPKEQGRSSIVYESPDGSHHEVNIGLADLIQTLESQKAVRTLSLSQKNSEESDSQHEKKMEVSGPTLNEKQGSQLEFSISSETSSSDTLMLPQINEENSCLTDIKTCPLNNHTAEQDDDVGVFKSDDAATEFKKPEISAIIDSSNNDEDSPKSLPFLTTPSGDLVQPTLIQLPKDMVSAFLPHNAPVKLGLKTHEDDLNALRCQRCDFQAFFSRQLQDHMSKQHRGDLLECRCCSFLAFENTSLVSHFLASHPRHICPVCHYTADYAYVIKRHMMRHDPKGCVCEVCGKRYKDQYILKMHVKMVHLPAEVLFECSVCSKKFTRKAHLKRHLRIHAPMKPFKCDQCDYRGCEKSDISKHLLVHEAPKHTCEVCGKTFRHLKNKELHVKRHNGQKDYKCGVCDFYGYTFTDIRKHIERKHAEIGNYEFVCDKCGNIFKTEPDLKVHYAGCEISMNFTTEAAPISIDEQENESEIHETTNSQTLTLEDGRIIESTQVTTFNGETNILEGVEYQYASSEDIQEVANQLEELQKSSGKHVTIVEFDNANHVIELVGQLHVANVTENSSGIGTVELESLVSQTLADSSES